VDVHCLLLSQEPPLMWRPQPAPTLWHLYKITLRLTLPCFLQASMTMALDIKSNIVRLHLISSWEIWLVEVAIHPSLGILTLQKIRVAFRLIQIWRLEVGWILRNLRMHNRMPLWMRAQGLIDLDLDHRICQSWALINLALKSSLKAASQRHMCPGKIEFWMKYRDLMREWNLIFTIEESFIKTLRDLWMTLSQKWPEKKLKISTIGLLKKEENVIWEAKK